MAKYSKRADGRYVANRIIDGKRKVFYGKTCKEIDEKIRNYSAEKEQGSLFRDLAERWWEIKQKEISKKSVMTYTAAYNRVKAEFGQKRITEITAPELKRYMMAFADKGYHKSTGNIELTIIKQIMNFAIECGEIEFSPAAAVRVPKHMPTKIVPALTKEQETLAKGYKSGQAGLFVQVLLHTGLRFGEVAALSYADIDRKKGCISITKKVSYAESNRGELEDHLKTENGLREIPLFPPLAKLLPRGRIGYVFAGEDGGWMPSQRLYKLWEEFCRESDLMEDGKPVIHPHQMRHLYATVLYESGVDQKTAARWMGDTEEIVRKVYEDLRPHKEEQEREKVERYLIENA